MIVKRATGVSLIVSVTAMSFIVCAAGCTRASAPALTVAIVKRAFAARQIHLVDANDEPAKTGMWALIALDARSGSSLGATVFIWKATSRAAAYASSYKSHPFGYVAVRCRNVVARSDPSASRARRSRIAGAVRALCRGVKVRRVAYGPKRLRCRRRDCGSLLLPNFCPVRAATTSPACSRRAQLP
jgi:hypothetical protein